MLPECQLPQASMCCTKPHLHWRLINTGDISRLPEIYRDRFPAQNFCYRRLRCFPGDIPELSRLPEHSSYSIPPRLQVKGCVPPWLFVRTHYCLGVHDSAETVRLSYPCLYSVPVNPPLPNALRLPESYFYFAQNIMLLLLTRVEVASVPNLYLPI